MKPKIVENILNINEIIENFTVFEKKKIDADNI